MPHGAGAGAGVLRASCLTMLENAAGLAPPRVFVADDDAESRDVLARALRAEGYEVACYATENSLLHELCDAHAAGCAPALILASATLPPAVGLGVLRALRENDPRVPIVLLAALGSEELLNEAFALGASLVLSKPIPAGDLRRIVRCFIAGRHAG